MKHIVSLSGGIGSYFTLKRVLEKNDKEDVIAVFCDTLFEDGDLYRFLRDIEKKFDIKVHRLCEGKTPFELAFEDNFIFNSRVANCSKKLKSRPFKKWLKGNFKPGECILYLGIDFTEMHRIDAIEKNYKPYKVAFPMCEEPYLYKYEMLEELEKEGIEIPRLYHLNFAHNNCGGFCFKAGIGHFKNLYEKDRNLYLKIEDKEAMLIERIKNRTGKDYAILYRTRNKVKRPFPLSELREEIEKDNLTQSECNDIGGCGCFVEMEMDDEDE